MPTHESNKFISIFNQNHRRSSKPKSGKTGPIKVGYSKNMENHENLMIQSSMPEYLIDLPQNYDLQRREQQQYFIRRHQYKQHSLNSNLPLLRTKSEKDTHQSNHIDESYFRNETDHWFDPSSNMAEIHDEHHHHHRRRYQQHHYRVNSYNPNSSSLMTQSAFFPILTNNPRIPILTKKSLDPYKKHRNLVYPNSLIDESNHPHPHLHQHYLMKSNFYRHNSNPTDMDDEVDLFNNETWSSLIQSPPEKYSNHWDSFTDGSEWSDISPNKRHQRQVRHQNRHHHHRSSSILNEQLENQP